MLPEMKDDRDEIYYAWRKSWAYAIPASGEGEKIMNAHGAGFQEGWRACEKWIEKQSKK